MDNVPDRCDYGTQVIRVRATPFAGVFIFVALLAFAGGASATPFPNAAPITINDCCDPQPAETYPATVTVAGGALSGTVTKVTVTLTGLIHGASSDLDLLLVGPLGQSVLLVSDTGVAAGGGTVTFDDAAAPLPNGVPIASGSYQPTNNAEDCPNAGDSFPAPAPSGPYGATLSVFNTTVPAGTWSLYAVDDCEVDSGSIASGFIVTITTTGSAATPFSNSGAITIGDCCVPEPAGTYPSTITVSSLTENINGLSVKLNGLTHAYTADVNVLLEGPLGQKVLLMSDVGRDAAAVDLTFNDAAGSPLPASSNLATGTYTPTNGVEECATGVSTDVFPAPAPASPYGSLLSSAFNGTNGNGDWKLWLVDDCGNNAGTLANGWALEISTGPTSVVVSSLSARRVAKGVIVRWRTGQETSLLGFNLYRGKTKLNARLIQAKAKSSRGASYSFSDRQAKRGLAYSYRLQAVGINGKRGWRGTVRVRAR